MSRTLTDNIIDDIFAHSAPLKKQKKRKINHSQSQPIEPKPPAPEIVHDPSSQPSRLSTSRRGSHTSRYTVPSQVLSVYIYHCGAPAFRRGFSPSLVKSGS